MTPATATHCGGCGFVHEPTNVTTFDRPTNFREALRAAGRKRGHCFTTYDYDGDSSDLLVLAVGTCCRDVRLAGVAMGHGPFGDGRGSTCWLEDISEAQATAEAAAEEAHERQYASAYGLGL